MSPINENLESPVAAGGLPESEMHPKASWLTWMLMLLMLAGVLLASGTVIPQAAKKILLYPVILFTVAVFLGRMLTEMCQVTWNGQTATILVICCLGGYLGQQYLGFQKYVKFKQETTKPETIQILTYLQDQDELDLKNRVQKSLNPDLKTYLDWKYSPVKFLSLPSWVIFTGETFGSVCIACVLVYLAYPAHRDNQIPPKINLEGSI